MKSERKPKSRGSQGSRGLGRQGPGKVRGPGWGREAGAGVRAGCVDVSKKQSPRAWGSASDCTSGKPSPRMNDAWIVLHVHRNVYLFIIEKRKEENLFHTWHLI